MSSTSGTCAVEVWRGDALESVHEVSVAVADPRGRLRAFAGEPQRRLYARSSIKAWQALPLLEDGAAAQLGITDEELALCCASHSGEPHHVDLARSLLGRIGANEDALACGPHWPFHSGSARALRAAGKRPGRIHNNCSGKHSGMLALAHFHGWPAEGYQRPEHPVQQRMLREVSRWTELAVSDVGVAVDGCGVATFAVPLTALAAGFARLGAEAGQGGSEAARIAGIMLRYPEVIAGTDRLCTAVVQATRGQVFAKIGAEGVYCAGVPGQELGIAIKVHDGALRAVEPALVGVLDALGVLSAEAREALERWATPDVKNTRDECVGRLRPVVRLSAAA